TIITIPSAKTNISERISNDITRFLDNFSSNATIRICVLFLIAKAADRTVKYDIKVNTICSLHAGSGINDIYLPATAIVVISISPIKRILHSKSITLYAISYMGFTLSRVLKNLGIFSTSQNNLGTKV